MSFIGQYLQFLKPEKRVPKNQLKQGNIYRIVRYGGDTKRGINARYVFVIGRVIDKGRIIQEGNFEILSSAKSDLFYKLLKLSN